MKTIAQQLNVKEFPFVIKDAKGNNIYYEYADGFWTIYDYNANGLQIYIETSDGIIIENPSYPEYTMEELIAKLGNFKLKK